MGKKKQYDLYAEFGAKSKDEQRESILNLTAMCIDGATVSLARMIEIYFDHTRESNIERLTCSECGCVSWMHYTGEERYVPSDAILSHSFQKKFV